MVDLSREVVNEVIEKESEFFELLEALKEADDVTETEIGELEITNECGDAECSTGLYLKKDDETFRIPEWALFSIRRRFKNMSEILPLMTPEDQAKMLNMSIGYLEDTDVLLYTRGDFVEGLHSKHYSVIPPEDIYKAFRANLMFSFDEFRYLSGLYCHDFMEAMYQVVDVDTATKYAKALIDAGESVSLSDIEFQVSLSTSDAASASVSVQPYVIISGKKCAPLSRPLRDVKHRDGASLQDVKDMFLKLYSYNADAVENLTRLLSIELTYPSSVIKRLAKDYKLPLRPLKSIAERFNAEALGKTMTAHDLYMNACLALRDEKFLNMRKSNQIEAQDAFSRILEVTEDEWKKMDKPGPTLLDI